MFESYRIQIDRDNSNSGHVLQGRRLEATMEVFVSLPKNLYQDRNYWMEENHTILQSND